MRKSTLLRAAAITAGALALTGAAGMAFAADEYGSEGVAVSFKIEPQTVWGDLSMTVEDDEVKLHEDGSDATNYRFSGTLPTVTVTDERDPATIPANVGWYVLGQIGDFEGDGAQDDIPASQLGWVPEVIDGGELGLVTEGDAVLTSLDANTAIDPDTGLIDNDNPNNVGLVDQELLSLAIDSGLIRDESEWTATAELILKTAKTTAAGTYTANLTLTLME